MDSKLPSPSIANADVSVTSEMVEAGVHVIAEEYGVTGDNVAKELAEEVFRAMIAVWPDRILLSSYGEDTGPRRDQSGV